jgi:hypothetical protein
MRLFSLLSTQRPSKASVRISSACSLCLLHIKVLTTPILAADFVPGIGFQSIDKSCDDSAQAMLDEVAAIAREIAAFEDDERDFFESPITSIIPPSTNRGLPTPPPSNNASRLAVIEEEDEEEEEELDAGNFSFSATHADPSRVLPDTLLPPQAYELDFTPDTAGVILPSHPLFIDLPGITLVTPPDGDGDEQFAVVYDPPTPPPEKVDIGALFVPPVDSHGRLGGEWEIVFFPGVVVGGGDGGGDECGLVEGGFVAVEVQPEEDVECESEVGVAQVFDASGVFGESGMLDESRVFDNSGVLDDPFSNDEDIVEVVRVGGGYVMIEFGDE